MKKKIAIFVGLISLIGFMNIPQAEESQYLPCSPASLLLLQKEIIEQNAENIFSDHAPEDLESVLKQDMKQSLLALHSAKDPSLWLYNKQEQTYNKIFNWYEEEQKKESNTWEYPFDDEPILKLYKEKFLDIAIQGENSVIPNIPGFIVGMETQLYLSQYTCYMNTKYKKELANGVSVTDVLRNTDNRINRLNNEISHASDTWKYALEAYGHFVERFIQHRSLQALESETNEMKTHVKKIEKTSYSCLLPNHIQQTCVK